MDRHEPDTPPATDNALELAKDKTRQYARKLWDIVTLHSTMAPSGETEKPASSPPARFKYKNKTLLYILTTIPYALLLAFGVSFFWDFEGVSGRLFSYPLIFEGILRIISISGLIGFLTNWLAITMLFKPSKRRPVLGLGLIPSQKDRIAYRLAQTVEEDLINPEIIKQKLHKSRAISKYREEATFYLRTIIDSPAFRNDIKEWVVIYVQDMIADPEIRGAVAQKILVQIEETLENKAFEKVAFKAYTFVRGREMQEMIDEALTQLPISIESGLDKLDELLDRLPEKLEQNSDTIEDVVTNLLYKLINKLDVHTLVEENLREYDEQRLSNIIRGATNEQLKYIQYLGAVLGTIGGFVIWEPVLSTGFIVLITGGILSVDTLLLKIKRSGDAGK